MVADSLNNARYGPHKQSYTSQTMMTQAHDPHEHRELQAGLLASRDRFLGYVRKRVDDSELAEDILQDSLLRALQAPLETAASTAPAVRPECRGGCNVR